MVKATRNLLLFFLQTSGTHQPKIVPNGRRSKMYRAANKNYEDSYCTQKYIVQKVPLIVYLQTHLWFCQRNCHLLRQIFHVKREETHHLNCTDWVFARNN